ncbi:Release factor glutamine methyltransferase [[Clostridium] ultunense Esp]|uniref:Release factor glutamine methyltransferase n=1 Tax=[Clostridium] ultunense Esp TaxID=1288971 RepID=M1YS88_9FIRM|nr:peptide chain release factor N(5)-glutamine methyltransferase [Schnuerera ultunensis]CCQ93430.1 Release factor glutamine methyltransferase [[Clostridium] ultunense Esp]SHD76569.1 Release factor glutamine methyltransferase [[Clostridium] ultunense Esp]
MDINQLLQRGVDLIKDRPYTNPVLEATLLLSKLLNVDKTYIYTHGKDKVSRPIMDKFLELMEKRAEGYPIQYIINEKEFMGLDFYVDEGVLIPRSDTEILVEYVLEYIDNKYKGKPINILDLGIGSGAIALSIAYYKKNANVYGVDLHDIPLKIARINKERFKLNNVNLFKGDLFQGVEGLGEKFHIITSNPPYIPKREIETLQEEVKDYEPKEALDGGEDGLDFYRRIIPESKEYLIKDGLLIFEIGYDQSKQITNMMVDEGFENVGILKDLQGLDRVVLGIMGKRSWNR